MLYILLYVPMGYILTNAIGFREKIVGSTTTKNNADNSLKKRRLHFYVSSSTQVVCIIWHIINASILTSGVSIGALLVYNDEKTGDGKEDKNERFMLKIL